MGSALAEGGTVPTPHVALCISKLDVNSIRRNAQGSINFLTKILTHGLSLVWLHRTDALDLNVTNRIERACKSHRHIRLKSRHHVSFRLSCMFCQTARQTFEQHFGSGAIGGWNRGLNFDEWHIELKKVRKMNAKAQKVEFDVETSSPSPPPSYHCHLAAILPAGTLKQQRIAFSVYTCGNHFSNKNGMIALFHAADDAAFHIA